MAAYRWRGQLVDCRITIVDADGDVENGTGFLFKPANAEALIGDFGKGTGGLYGPTALDGDPTAGDGAGFLVGEIGVEVYAAVSRVAG